jgi:hypothetical protein
MNLDNIPETVWGKLATTAIQHKSGGGVMNALIMRF